MGIADPVYEQTKKLSGHLAREVVDFVGYLADRQEREHDRDLMSAQLPALTSVWDNLRMRRGTMFERGDLVLIPFRSPTCQPPKNGRFLW
jgi:hypothetical protein